jgi:hypothetical protein
VAFRRFSIHGRSGCVITDINAKRIFLDSLFVKVRSTLIGIFNQPLFRGFDLARVRAALIAFRADKSGSGASDGRRAYGTVVLPEPRKLNAARPNATYWKQRHCL